MRADTQVWLKTEAPRCKPPGYRQFARLDSRSMALHTVRGYWLVEELERRMPGFFRRQFADWQGRRALESEMAALLGLPVGQFWQRVDDVIV